MSATPGAYGLPILASDPPAPAAGVILYFVGTEMRFQTPVSGVVTLAAGLGQEAVEDIVGALIQSTASVNVTYNDPSGALTLDVLPAGIIHDALNGAGANTHAQIDLHIAASDNPHSVTAAQTGAEPLGAVANHVADADPHPQYETAAEAQAKVDAHANLTNNPHAVTKTQVGLGNVDNTADVDKPVSTAQAAADLAVQNFAINRANHTGSQLAATISDFENAIRQIYDKTVAQNNAEQVNTDNGTWINRHDITKTPQHTDNYEIEVHYTWAYDDGANNFEGELLVNGGIVRAHDQEPKDVGGTDGGAGTDQRHMAVMKYIFAATQAVDFDVVFRFQPQTNGVEATVRDSVITIKRALEV